MTTLANPGQLSGSTHAGVGVDTVTKAYNPQAPGVASFLQSHFGPPRFAPTPPHKASEEVAAYSSFFHSSTEKQLFKQLLEEGRYSPSAIEGQGFPESFGELVVFLKSIATPGFTTSTMPGSIRVPHTKVGGQTVPSASPTQQGAAERGQQEAGSLLGPLADILKSAGLTVVLALAGLALVIYGVMIAVRPRDRALSIPVPK